MCTEVSLAKAKEVDAFCHAAGVAFIRGDVRGVFGSLFCDFGPGFDVLDTDGDLIVVSQFTLHASTKKGNRPSFIRAARPDKATPLYEQFVQALSAGLGKEVGTGVFGAHMEVALVNDGPVTIWIDTKTRE